MSDANDYGHALPIRVLIGNMAGVQLDLIADLITQQPDMVLVGHAQGALELLLAAGEQVDVLILGAPSLEHLPAICSHLLHEFPHLRIVALQTSGQVGNLYWLGLRRQKIARVSSLTLINSIRRVYRLDSLS